MIDLSQPLPAQVPAKHVLDMHSTGLPHCPHESHVSWTLYERSVTHRFAFGVHLGADAHEQVPQAQLGLHDCLP